MEDSIKEKKKTAQFIRPRVEKSKRPRYSWLRIAAWWLLPLLSPSTTCARVSVRRCKQTAHLRRRRKKESLRRLSTPISLLDLSYFDWCPTCPNLPETIRLSLRFTWETSAFLSSFKFTVGRLKSNHSLCRGYLYTGWCIVSWTVT